MRFYWPIAKVDAEQRMVWGYASTTAEDDQGETVTREALAAALDDYMQFANIREMHLPSAVGVATAAAIDDKGLYIAARIVDADAWEKVVEGVYKGFSIGGRVTARDPADRSLITALHLTEISVVDRPANPEAVFDCWKRATGNAAGGVVADGQATPEVPRQIWDCGIAGHRHLGKAEAVGCLEMFERVAALRSDDAGENPSTSGAHRHGEAEYADPGYRPDGRQRYPIDTERHIRTAWAFIHQPSHASRYTADQLERIRARIVDAWRVRIAPEGSPEADTARKNYPDAERLAQIIRDLDWLYDRIAATADDPPQPALGIIVELCDLVEALAAEEGAEPAVDASDLAEPELAAMAVSGALHKAGRRTDASVAAGFAKLAGEIMPRLDALQKRVEDIARTPLPPQATARGFAAIAKSEDAGGTDDDSIVAALARMTDEERTLALIKAAHASPIAPFSSAAGFPTR